MAIGCEERYTSILFDSDSPNIRREPVAGVPFLVHEVRVPILIGGVC